MSLVDYAASSDEDEPRTPAHEPEIQQVKESPPKRQRFEAPIPAPSSNDNLVRTHNRFTHLPSRIPGNERPPSKEVKAVSELKLPDASFLLNSPSVPSNPLDVLDHSSRVASAMAESAARKRELNGPAASYTRSKVPKGSLPHLKGVPDTIGSHLLPPQLAGRSNVVTEDIRKLFVRKQTNPST